MSYTYFGVDDDEINTAASRLDEQAEELLTVITALTEAVPGITAEASAFQAEYEPDAIHKAKVDELTQFITANGDNLRFAAESMQKLAQGMREFVEQNNATQEDNASRVDDIDGEVN